MKIAVTGSTGVVGRAVVAYALEHGHKVIGIDVANPTATDVESMENFKFVQADLKDPDVVMKVLEGCEAVIHLAAIRTPGDGKFETHDTNVTISWNVLRAAAELGITRVSQASSINAIGLYWNEKVEIDYFPIDEEHPCRPDDPYSLSKLICEIQADSVVRRHPKMRISSLRLHFVVPSREKAARSSHKHLWGYTLESSCAEAFLAAVSLPSDSCPFKTGHEAFFIVERDLGFDADVSELLSAYWRSVPIKGDIMKTGLFNCSKAEQLLGWKSKA